MDQAQSRRVKQGINFLSAVQTLRAECYARFLNSKAIEGSGVYFVLHAFDEFTSSYTTLPPNTAGVYQRNSGTIWLRVLVYRYVRECLCC